MVNDNEKIQMTNKDKFFNSCRMAHILQLNSSVITRIKKKFMFADKMMHKIKLETI